MLESIFSEGCEEEQYPRIGQQRGDGRCKSHKEPRRRHLGAVGRKCPAGHPVTDAECVPTGTNSGGTTESFLRPEAKYWLQGVFLFEKDKYYFDYMEEKLT